MSKLTINVLSGAFTACPMMEWREADRAKARPVKSAVTVKGEGVRFDGTGQIELVAVKDRMIAEVWAEGEASMHHELLPGAPRTITLGERDKVTVRVA